MIGWLGGITAFIVGLIWYLTHYLSKSEIEVFSKVTSNLVLLLIIVGFIVAALRKKLTCMKPLSKVRKVAFKPH